MNDLEKIKKQTNPFKVPPGYFENFEFNPNPSTPIKNGFKKYAFVIYSFSLVLFFGIFYFLNKSNTPTNTITNESITEYLYWQDINEDDLIEAYDAIDELTLTASDEAIMDYLIENDIALTDINEEL